MLFPIPPALICAVPQDDDLKTLALTEQQKTLFASLAQSGFKRLGVQKRALPDESYVTLAAPRAEYKLFVYVTESRTALQREVTVDESKEDAEKLYSPLLKSRFPQLTSSYIPSGDALDILLGTGETTIVLRLASPAQTATPLWLSSALEELDKAAQQLKNPPKATDPSGVTPTDPIGAALKTAGLTFTDIGNFYKLKYTFTDSKRAQFVFVRKAIWEYNSLKIQELYSTFYESETAPSAELTQKLFQKTFTIGGLILEAPSESQKLWRIRYRLDAPTTIPTNTLKTYLQLVAGTADALEKELNTEDKL